MDRAGRAVAAHRTVAAQAAAEPAVSGTEENPALVTATVDGRGGLIGLELDTRVYRRSDSRWLSETITTTARDAMDTMFFQLRQELDRQKGRT